MSKIYLILIDANSKWLYVRVMPNINASQTILEMCDIFSVMGLPNFIVTDNGPTWTSAEFTKFMYAIGIRHITISPIFKLVSRESSVNFQVSLGLNPSGECQRKIV